MYFSTGVGGIPEVLPPQFIYLVQPNHNSIIQGLRSAIEARANINMYFKDP